jgi:hypothetical protein
MATPKVEPPKDDWPQGDILAPNPFTDEMVEFYSKETVEALIKLQQEALLSKVEAELPEKYNNWSDVPDSVVGGLPSYSKKLTYRKAHNQSINQVKTTINKLRLEL